MHAVQPRPSQSIFKVGRKKFFEERELGEGAFGKVYKVKEDGRSGSVYALKKIEVVNNKAVDMVKKEINIMAKCKHAHIVSLYEVDIDIDTYPVRILILMEYCEGGNLNSRLARPSDTETNQRWMNELADAMNYLHTYGTVHRDLKPENVLLTASDTIKLGDFGLAREYAVLRQENDLSDLALMSYLNTVYMGTVAGSKPWMAPEVFDGRYTEKADIFSLGTIFYAILTRESISDGGKTYYGAFVSVGGQTIGLGMAMISDTNVMVPGGPLDGLSRSSRQLLHNMLTYDPKDRPSAGAVFEKVKAILRK